ncbi:MAG TPA: DUF3109 family protein [Bacteroidales bacterium]|jgi:hypothetical protein|nr:DUF3109 family protein [Bacteroidales bacterium]MBP7874772.1 DUF3109 family protein [Bacteroidales bacterium]MCZ2283539.1 DUF3109 family protein [Bacteroidales bacterium]HPX34564.1 DUF3109 family protein [Bacteroidales bacterium]HQB48305.1 DUF3109 family protein [Bacteroidales bacterium]
MIPIDNTIVSDNLAEIKFVCDLKKCKGACCVEGDFGAPLLEEEIGLIEDDIEVIKPFMTEAGIKTIDLYGVFDYDFSGEFVTPLVNGCECAFANFTDDIAWCAIEKAYEAGVTRFRKPVSCHLYPVRISTRQSFDAVNYHEWGICRPALINGKRLGIPLYKFLKEALIRRYGKTWYSKLEKKINTRNIKKDQA